MSVTVEELVSMCFDELRLSQRFLPYAQQAEQAGYPQLAKILRALVASETAREALFRPGVLHQASQTGDYFVCPHCGLVYDQERPKQCLVDPTPSEDFIVIQ
jgi:rubrerythrin